MVWVRLSPSSEGVPDPLTTFLDRKGNELFFALPFYLSFHSPFLTTPRKSLSDSSRPSTRIFAP